MNISEMWNSARLYSLKTLTASGTPTQLNAYEVNVGLLGSTNGVYEKCSSWSQMPGFYDDCASTGTLEPHGNKTFAYGTGSLYSLFDNYTYAGNIRMVKFPSVSKGYAEEVPMTLNAEALYCTVPGSLWTCGISLKRSHIQASQATLFNAGLTRYSIGGSYSYGY